MDKNIIYITSSFPFGNSEIWAINELSSLIKLGNNVTIIPRTGKGKIINQDAVQFTENLIDLPFLNWPIFIFFLKTVLFHPILFIRLCIQNMKQSNKLLDFVKGLIILPKTLFLTKTLKKMDIDHIHSFQTTSTAFMAYVLSFILKVPWSYTLHTSEIVNSRHRKSLNFQSRSASICRTISQKTANDLSNFIEPSLSKKVVKIHLGVEIKDFKKETGNINNPFIIVTPAELTTRKGHIYAIEAASKLVDKGIKNFHWFFYGSGPLLNELQQKVKELGLLNHCYFPGNLDHAQLLDKYIRNKVDIVVISSISTDVPEGIPVSLMEAMSFEIPVIASDCGGTNELVDNHSGILINQHNSEAIASAVIKLINQTDFRRKIGKDGRNKVKKDFDTMDNALDLTKAFNQANF